MTNKALHIVSFTVPFPANYGGAIDVFYKLKALHAQGVEITLHCFQYNRKQAKELLSYCKEVHYYQRKNSLSLFLSSTPYIVATRESKKLANNLLKDTAPILLEGVHCCSILEDNRFKTRKIIVRSHNIEHHYYEHLASSERNWVKKIYFALESKKLKKFEEMCFPLASEIWGISEKDTRYLQDNYGKGILVGAFHQFEKVESATNSISDLSTSKPFAFYHGNLSVGENNLAAKYLVEEVFANLQIPLIIAGNDPSNELVELCAKHNHVALKANITSDEIFDLLKSAQINVLPTFQSTGIKLKLLAALFMGKHCVVSPCMVEGTGLERLCSIAKDAKEFGILVEQKIQEDFTSTEIDKRVEVLAPFSNERNGVRAVESIGF